MKLTDRIIAPVVNLTDLIHIVITGDTSQDPAGSSYKANLQQLVALVPPSATVSGGTYNPITGIATFTNTTGGTFTVNSFFTSANDINVTGGTYNNSTGIATFTNTTGGTFSVSSFFTGSTDTYWVSGSTGTFSLHALNDSGLDATGDYALAEGASTIASGFASHAEGVATLASGQATHTEGVNTTASGNYSHAEGDYTISIGFISHAEGIQTTSLGNYSHSEGSGTTASGISSHAEGNGTISFGSQSHAEGLTTRANGNSSHAEGNSTTASGLNSHAEGTLTTASGSYSHAGGQFSRASGLNSFVHGSGSTASGINTIVLGANITGNTADTTYVDKLNIKTVGSTTPVTNIAVDANGFVVSASTGSSILAAEYVQTTQGTNASIAPGSAVDYLTDNPTGVYNTAGITTGTGPGGQGTGFLLPIGVYMIDFENSNSLIWALAIYKSTTSFSSGYAIDNNTIAGAATATTWIHGRAIVNAVAPTYIIISPVTSTAAIPTAGDSVLYNARITMLKIA